MLIDYGAGRFVRCATDDPDLESLCLDVPNGCHLGEPDKISRWLLRPSIERIPADGHQQRQRYESADNDQHEPWSTSSHARKECRRASARQATEALRITDAYPSAKSITRVLIALPPRSRAVTVLATTSPGTTPTK